MMREFDVFEIAKKIMEEVRKENEKMESFNVMILGKTGVGKSTLLNSVFSQKIANTGVGRPITDKIRKITKKGYPLTIYDTPGLELDGDNAVESLLKDVTSIIQKGFDGGDIGKAIHCIWYCVSVPSDRFEKAEIDFLKRLHKERKGYEVPVVVVLTKAFSKKNSAKMKQEIEKENLPVVNIIPVLSEDYEIDEDIVVKAYGKEELCGLTLDIIPDVVSDAFVAMSKSIKLKKQKAQAIVGTAATGAAAIGAVPIPIADAAILVPCQITMLAKLTAIFGVKMDKSGMVALLSAAIGPVGAMALGKGVVAGLIKLIPGPGAVAGGAIAAAVAAAITAALGEAYITILTMICKGELSTADLQTDYGKKMFKELFEKRLKLKRDENGKVMEQ